MKRILWIVFGLLIVLGVSTGIAYLVDRDQRFDALSAGGTIIETAMGPVEYRMQGSGDGNVLLFLHGTPGGYDQGPPPEGNTRSLTFSRPGYLGTALSVGPTPAEQADVAAALLDALHIDRVGVLGASGGGPAAYLFAARHPERTIGLVAMEAISGSMPDDVPEMPSSDFLLWLMLSAARITQDDAGIVRMIAPNESDRDRILSDPETQAEVASLFWSLWPPSLRGPGTDNDFEQFRDLELPLASIQVPTLIVHGTQDQSVPFAHGEYAAATIPGARLHAIQGAGHMMPFAHAAEVNEVVTAFLAPLD